MEREAASRHGLRRVAIVVAVLTGAAANGADGATSREPFPLPKPKPALLPGWLDPAPLAVPLPPWVTLGPAPDARQLEPAPPGPKRGEWTTTLDPDADLGELPPAMLDERARERGQLKLGPLGIDNVLLRLRRHF